jgi:hypothetical protein
MQPALILAWSELPQGVRFRSRIQLLIQILPVILSQSLYSVFPNNLSSHFVFSSDLLFLVLSHLLLSASLTSSSVQHTFSLGQIILALHMIGIDCHLKSAVHLNTV